MVAERLRVATARSAAQGDRFSSIENVFGSSYGDFMNGNFGANRLDGSGGNDWLFGEDGNDILAGGSGDDVSRGERSLQQ